MFGKFVGRRWQYLAAVAVLAGSFGLGVAQEKKPEKPKPKDIVSVAREATDLKTFCKLLESSGLAETLSGTGTFTVFAPTDEAFNKLGKEKLEELQKPENKAKLQKILKGHVLDGRTTVAELEKMKVVKAVTGQELTITVKEGVVMIESAKVTKSDVHGSNGLIHVVDTVLMPKD